MIKQFRVKKPIIEAIKFDGENFDEIKQFCPNAQKLKTSWGADTIVLTTTKGFMEADKDDWVVKNEKGDFYICQSGFFDVSYELIEPELTQLQLFFIKLAITHKEEILPIAENALDDHIFEEDYGFSKNEITKEIENLSAKLGFNL